MTANPVLQSGLRRPALAVTTAFVLAIALCVAAIDRPLSTWAHTLHRPIWCVWLTWIADVPVPGSVLCLGIAGIAWLAGWRPGPLGRAMLAVCLATLAADAAKDVLKLLCGRTWPETWVNNNPSWIGNGVFGFFALHGGAGWASFPSGHSTVIAAPCAALWHAASRWRLLWATLPSLVVVGLLGSNYHFAADCVAGLGIGLAFGTMTVRLCTAPARQA